MMILSRPREWKLLLRDCYFFFVFFCMMSIYFYVLFAIIIWIIMFFRYSLFSRCFFLFFFLIFMLSLRLFFIFIDLTANAFLFLISSHSESIILAHDDVHSVCRLHDRCVQPVNNHFILTAYNHQL